MEELFKNSLLGQLQEMGFASDIEEEPNPLAIKVNGDIKDSPFIDNPILDEEKKSAKNLVKETLKENIEQKTEKKRLNDFDFDILQDSAIKKASDKFSGSNVFGKFLYKYFPKLYKGFILKKGLKKLNMLNQTARDLLAKKIPYGESDERYNALIEYLSSANTIHAKLIKKI